MKKIILVVVLCVIVFYTHAQEKKTFWDNGNLKSITIHDQNGKKTGEWNWYFETGDLKKTGSYVEGEKTGTWNEYYYNGERKKRTYYTNGLITEKSSYYENGRKMVKGTFDENEKKHGVWEQYYDYWELKLKGEYHHGNKHGQWKYYTDSGKLNKIENYNTGKKISKWQVGIDAGDYSENDRIKVVDAVEVVTSNFDGNRLNGEWKFYNEKGKCIEKGNYNDDEKDGKWTYYHDNGQLKKEELWFKGKLMEITSHFDNKGKPIKRGTLNEGYGTVLDHHINGTVATLDYVNGEIIDWNNYNLLNTLAWDVYENENDTEKLAKAIEWVKRSLELNKNYYNTDTYAALLYKTGNYKKALPVAEEAVKIAKKNNDDFSTTTKLIEDIYIKMKQY
ncbi:MAG TPA: hypothetical protein DDZ39_12620 [Flavobacteriaceae bacterium]|jgi:antitoxin component YwqK of YwqJK toxin-antitoxin module|nr:hypothetical protein [Flavobacteriaceae bacterium]